VKVYDLAISDVSAEVFEDSLLLGCDTILLGDCRRFRKTVAPLSVRCKPLNPHPSMSENLNPKINPIICMEGLRKNMKNLLPRFGLMAEVVTLDLGHNSTTTVRLVLSSVAVIAFPQNIIDLTSRRRRK